MKKKSFRLIALPSAAVFLTACGGGGESTVNTQPITSTTTVSATAQPRTLDAINWQNARLIETDNLLQSTVEVVGSKLNINVASKDISQGAHVQIYINSDNKPETGFQFENEAWEESGVDYLVEDGTLYKSTANNTGWNWNVNIGSIDYSIDSNNANATIDLSSLGEICNNLKVGIMTRDEFWDISTFSPASSKMQTFNVSYCNTQIVDIIKPQINMLGANPLILSVNDTFNDPGATASDNIDGDITNKITSQSLVDTTTAGSYDVIYSVTDNSGNSANITRTVIVNNDVVTPGIVVDGDSNDWSNIPTFSSSADAIMKVADDEAKIYILVTSSNLGQNTQVMIDSDNNASTGFNLSTQISSWLAGADYMVENNSLDKACSCTLWSWSYGVSSIEFIKTTDSLEIAIKKSDLDIIGNKIPMGFISRTEDWNVSYILPNQNIAVYTMQNSIAVNPVTANNDSATTINNQSITIDVKANDSTTANGGLTTKRIVTQPNSGSAVISQNKIVYTPDTSFTGTVNFSYEIANINGDTDIASVRIIVTAPVVANSAPVAGNDSATTIENTSTTVSVLSNDSDTNGDTLSITSVSSPNNGGSATRSNNVINYTPATGFTGNETFTYTITDGNGGSDTATVSVTVSPASVNNAPDAVEDSASVFFNDTVTVNVLANDTDPDGDTLSVVPSSVAALTLGQATLNPNGTITFDPQGNVASLSVFYTVTDGRGGTDSAVLTIASTDPDDDNVSFPTVSNEFVTTQINTPIFIDVLANDFDSDGDTLSIDMVDNPANGTTEKVTQNGIAGILYTPDPGFTGVDIFYYGVPDGRGNNGSGFVEVTVE